MRSDGPAYPECGMGLVPLIRLYIHMSTTKKKDNFRNRLGLYELLVYQVEFLN